MSKYKFSAVVGEEARDKAIADIMAWGYPRALREGEIESSFLVRVEPEAVIFWLEPLDSRKIHLSMHLVIRDEERGIVSRDPHIMNGFIAICEMLNAKRIYGIPLEGSDIEGLTNNFGWQKNDLGYFYEVR